MSTSGFLIGPSGSSWCNWDQTPDLTSTTVWWDGQLACTVNINTDVFLVAWLTRFKIRTISPWISQNSNLVSDPLTGSQTWDNIVYPPYHDELQISSRTSYGEQSNVGNYSPLWALWPRIHDKLDVAHEDFKDSAPSALPDSITPIDVGLYSGWRYVIVKLSPRQSPSDDWTGSSKISVEYGTTGKHTLVLTLYVVGLAREHVIHWENCIWAICPNDHSLLQFICCAQYQPRNKTSTNATARTAVSDIVILEVHVPGGSIKYLLTPGKPVIPSVKDLSSSLASLSVWAHTTWLQPPLQGYT